MTRVGATSSRVVHSRVTVPAVDPARSREAALGIVRTLRSAGHVAYFAGGCVRDELLGLVPSDYDVATDATPLRLRQLFPYTNEVGASFGVMLVQTGRGLEKVINEVATFRADGTYTDKRRPDSVAFSTPEADAQRRDFTMNALFLDPLDDGGGSATSPCGGKVIDFVGGRADLKARVVRAVGDPTKRLAEDNLRALRAVRLAAKLGFVIEEGTANAIRGHASELGGVSRERIGDEVRRMLAPSTRAGAIRTLNELGLDAPTLTEPHAEHAFVRLAHLPEVVTTGTALAAWAVDRGMEVNTPEERLARWRVALCLSNEEVAEFGGVVRGIALLRGGWLGLGVAAQKRAAGSAWFGSALLLLESENVERARAVQARVEELRRTVSGLSPPAYITGDDLVAQGMKPGPGFRRILDAVYDAQLEGRVASRDDASMLARELARTLGV